MTEEFTLEILDELIRQAKEAGWDPWYCDWPTIENDRLMAVENEQ